jgi:ABC-type bacteriocin/lantibiotic exporter with double-glycine peptidase domain
MRCVKWPGVCLSVLLPTVLAGALAAGPGIWLNVPFVRQQANGCGAACISMVMQYWRKSQDAGIPPGADVRRIQRILYSPQARGIYASDMERYFRQNGFRVFAFRGTLEDLRRHLAKGRPLIVCLKDSGKAGPLHYVVVVGLDRQEGVVLVNDPAQRKLLKMDRANFEERWRPMHNWTLLAVPGPAH